MSSAQHENSFIGNESFTGLRGTTCSVLHAIEHCRTCRAGRPSRSLFPMRSCAPSPTTLAVIGIARSV